MNDETLDPVEYGVETTPPESIAQEAHRLVNGDRQSDYGHPRDNYEIVAALFNGYIGGVMLRDGGDWNGLTPADAAQLMLLLKVARFATGAQKRDTVVDEAGYAEVTARVVGIDP